MDLQAQRRIWAFFVLGVGLVLLGLCALEFAQVALVLGAVMVFAGLVGVLLG